MKNRIQSHRAINILLSPHSKNEAKPQRFWKAIELCLFVFFVTLTATYAQANPQGNSVHVPVENSLETAFPKLELVRCLFNEGRLVVRHEGDLKVLHSGDQLLDAGLKVVEAKSDRIVLHSLATQTQASGTRLPKTIVIISRDPDAQIKIRTYSSEPNDGDGPTPLLSGATSMKAAHSELSAQPAPVELSSPSTAATQQEEQDQPQ